MKTINYLPLEDEIRQVHKNDGLLDRLTRDGEADSLEDALTTIEDSARNARRQLRKFRRANHA